MAQILDDRLEIIVEGKAFVSQTLDFTVSQRIFGNPDAFISFNDYEWFSGANYGNSNPYELEVQGAGPPNGSYSGQELYDRLIANLNLSDFEVIKTDIANNGVKITIDALVPGYYFSATNTDMSATTVEIKSSGALYPQGGNECVITFTSEGIDTTELTMEINQPDINLSEFLTFDWTATPSANYDVPVVPTSGVTGAATAQAFANVFEFNQNQNNDYILTVEDNVVTIRAIHTTWYFFYSITNTAGTADVDVAIPSLTIDAQILGQELTNTTTYCYLFEPLNVVISESNLLAKKIYIDIDVVDTSDNTVLIETLTKYGEFDINPGNPLTVDLMNLAKQYHNSNLFKFSKTTDFSSSLGKSSVVSKYKYRYKIYSDITTELEAVIVSKLPIVGIREFEDFTPVVDINSPITEAVEESIDLTGRWKDYPVIETVLKDPTLQDSTPTITVTNQLTGDHPCGGFVIWKSTLGGWMIWGMDIGTKSYKKKHTGRLEVNQFESTLQVGGDPYIPVDYTGIETTYSTTLKALSLNADELKVVSNIAYSPAIYLVKSDGRVQLMKVNSASAPFSTLANGGDFSISMKSIEKTTQSVM